MTNVTHGKYCYKLDYSLIIIILKNHQNLQRNSVPCLFNMNGHISFYQSTFLSASPRFIRYELTLHVFFSHEHSFRNDSIQFFAKQEFIQKFPSHSEIGNSEGWQFEPEVFHGLQLVIMSNCSQYSP